MVWSLQAAEPLMPVWNDWGITANQLSIASIVLRLLAVAVLLKMKVPILTPALVLVLFLAGVWLDNVDGTYARAYGEPTTLGAYLDHGGDVVTSLALVAAIYYKFGRAPPKRGRGRPKKKERYGDDLRGVLKPWLWVAALSALVGLSAVGCAYDKPDLGKDPLSATYYARVRGVCDSGAAKWLRPEGLGLLAFIVGCLVWIIRDVRRQFGK